MLTSALALALGGCLVSEEPLLDAKNGRAAPLVPGAYDACQYEADGGEPDCRVMEVKRAKDARYEFYDEEDEELTFIRFRRIGRGIWLAQLIGEDDEDYFYFVGERRNGDFVLTMIMCEDIPESVRAKYSARGEMEVDDDASVCEVKTLRAATASAKAYRTATTPESRSHIVYRKRADNDEE